MKEAYKKLKKEKKDNEKNKQNSSKKNGSKKKITPSMKRKEKKLIQYLRHYGIDHLFKQFRNMGNDTLLCYCFVLKHLYYFFFCCFKNGQKITKSVYSQFH